MMGQTGKPNPKWGGGRKDARSDRAMLITAGVVLLIFLVLVVWAWLD